MHMLDLFGNISASVKSLFLNIGVTVFKRIIPCISWLWNHCSEFFLKSRSGIPIITGVFLFLTALCTNIFVAMHDFSQGFGVLLQPFTKFEEWIWAGLGLFFSILATLLPQKKDDKVLKRAVKEAEENEE